MRSAIRSVELPDPRADLASGLVAPQFTLRRARASSRFRRMPLAGSGRRLRKRPISCAQGAQPQPEGRAARRPRPEAECATKLARASAPAKRWAVVESDAGDSLGGPCSAGWSRPVREKGLGAAEAGRGGLAQGLASVWWSRRCGMKGEGGGGWGRRHPRRPPPPLATHVPATIPKSRSLVRGGAR